PTALLQQERFHHHEHAAIAATNGTTQPYPPAQPTGTGGPARMESATRQFHADTSLPPVVRAGRGHRPAGPHLARPPHPTGTAVVRGGSPRRQPGTDRPHVTLSQTHLLRAADRKSTRLNSSHVSISYAVFC